MTQSVIELDVQSPPHTGGMPVLGYELSYTSYGTSGHWYGPVFFPPDASAARGRPRFRITGLMGGTGYQFNLAARSIVGSGTPIAISIRTLEATRPGPVQVNTKRSKFLLYVIINNAHANTSIRHKQRKAVLLKDWLLSRYHTVLSTDFRWLEGLPLNDVTCPFLSNCPDWLFPNLSFHPSQQSL